MCEWCEHNLHPARNSPSITWTLFMTSTFAIHPISSWNTKANKHKNTHTHNIVLCLTQYFWYSQPFGIPSHTYLRVLHNQYIYGKTVYPQFLLWMEHKSNSDAQVLIIWEAIDGTNSWSGDLWQTIACVLCCDYWFIYRDSAQTVVPVKVWQPYARRLIAEPSVGSGA